MAWCAARRFVVVRDERARRLSVAADNRSWGQPDLGPTRKGGKQPRQRRSRQLRSGDLRPASKTGRCNESESVIEPPLAAPFAQIGSIRADQQRVPAAPKRLATPQRHNAGRTGGYPESLRRTASEVAGEELDTTPVQRLRSERGNRSVIVRTGVGPADEADRGGVSVVVRGRESRPHGEGKQQVRNEGTGKPGGRW